MEGGRRHGKLQSRSKSKVETGLASSQAAERFNVPLDFGWRSASALRLLSYVQTGFSR